MGGASKAQQAFTADRRSKAIQMRIAKVDLQTIADRLGYSSRAAASVDISRALQRYRAEEDRSIDMYREQEIAGLDRAQAAIWPRVLAGELAAVDSYNRLVQTRCRLLGLFAPTEQRVITVDLVEQEIVRLEGELGYQHKIFELEAD